MSAVPEIVASGTHLLLTMVVPAEPRPAACLAVGSCAAVLVFSLLSLSQLSPHALLCTSSTHA
jgi:hypothetical protein